MLPPKSNSIEQFWYCQECVSQVDIKSSNSAAGRAFIPVNGFLNCIRYICHFTCCTSFGQDYIRSMRSIRSARVQQDETPNLLISFATSTLCKLSSYLTAHVISMLQALRVLSRAKALHIVFKLEVAMLYMPRNGSSYPSQLRLY